MDTTLVDTQNKETPMTVGLELEKFDADEPDVEQISSLVGGAFHVTGE